jgi:probable phosphoglycerate mutase
LELSELVHIFASSANGLAIREQNKKMKTTLYLTRHGETVDNARQLMQGQTQGQLNDVGVVQAEQLRERLAGTHFDAYVASDLKRAIDTARILAGPQQPIDTTPLLRERDWGSFTGRYIPDLKGEVWPDDIETLDDLLARAGRFLDFVRTRYQGKTVLAVGHGIVNKAIQAVYYGKQMRDVERMANCEVRILEL